jgi:uracil phosphoribosyltransferase
MPQVTEVGHPLVRHHLTLLRDVHTPASEFRELVERLAVLLVYEAADDLELGTISVKTPYDYKICKLENLSGSKRKKDSNS